MGLFDFLKQNELAQIAKLTKKCNRQDEAISLLNEQIEALSAYQGIVDVDAQIKQRWDEYQVRENQYTHQLEQIQSNIDKLALQYKEAKVIYDALEHQIELFRNEVNLTEYGIYEPCFDEYDTAESFKDEIREIRAEQKDLISDKAAVLGGDSFTLNGSQSAGQAMVNRWKKIMLRAFNGECDSFIAKADWNNFTKMQERIKNSYAAINKMMAKHDIHITDAYLQLKLIELQLTYTYKYKKQQEKEEQRAIREQMREEERAVKEFEAARAKAQKEEAIYQKALDQARKQLESATGAKHEEMESQIAELEARLKEAEENNQRAQSMAQQTKRGHVYVISNIGSFGESVYKIGMTRRLDPLDRVLELGDASVPFKFDVHAMIFSDNAPALENKLHRIFDKNRVNRINNRKEFFHVNLDEIEKIVKEENASIEFTKIAEAKEYRETYALKQKEALGLQKPVEQAYAFPTAI